jgi:hypothetical protein
MQCIKQLIRNKRIYGTRNLWTVKKGHSYGYLSEIYTSGLFFPTNYVYFREYDPFENRFLHIYSCSITKLPYKCMDKISRIGCTNTIVKIEYSVDVVTSPREGDILFNTHIHDIAELDITKI